MSPQYATAIGTGRTQQEACEDAMVRIPSGKSHSSKNTRKKADGTWVVTLRYVLG